MLPVQRPVAEASYTAASARCAAQGGLLWWPRNASEELAVEVWFGLLNQNHAVWLGMTRGSAAGASSEWTASDGATSIGLYPSSSTSSYAHWGSDHYASRGGIL